MSCLARWLVASVVKRLGADVVAWMHPFFNRYRGNLAMLINGSVNWLLDVEEPEPEGVGRVTQRWGSIWLAEDNGAWNEMIAALEKRLRPTRSWQGTRLWSILRWLSPTIPQLTSTLFRSDLEPHLPTDRFLRFGHTFNDERRLILSRWKPANIHQFCVFFCPPNITYELRTDSCAMRAASLKLFTLHNNAFKNLVCHALGV